MMTVKVAGAEPREPQSPDHSTLTRRCPGAPNRGIAWPQNRCGHQPIAGQALPQPPLYAE